MSEDTADIAMEPFGSLPDGSRIELYTLPTLSRQTSAGRFTDPIGGYRLE